MPSMFSKIIKLTKTLKYLTPATKLGNKRLALIYILNQVTAMK
jgi:hypothetical protein